MHARELVELSALVSAFGSALVRRNEPLPLVRVQEYWSAAKIRLDAWSRDLKGYSDRYYQSMPYERTKRWLEIRAVVEEILATETLTRVFTGVVAAAESHLPEKDCEPIARSVLLGHGEARRRALTLLVHGPGVRIEEAVALNRTRSHLERWTDLLLGYIVVERDVAELAHDAGRAREFARDLKETAAWRAGGPTWSILRASLKGGFRSLLEADTGNGRLNQRIADAVIGCFEAVAGEEFQAWRTPWTDRLLRLADDAQAMLDELNVLEGIAEPAGRASSFSGLPDALD